MGNETIVLLLEQIDSLRKALFGALNDVRKELGEKIDDSASERRAQIKELMETGCHQGQLDRQTIAQHKASLERLENLWASLAIGTKGKEQSEDGGHKKFSIDLKKMKFNFTDFRATDIVVILIALMLGGWMLTQYHRVNTIEQKAKAIETVVSQIKIP
jgi:hypothetical protein